MARSHIVLENHFPQHRSKFERAFKTGMERGGHDIVASAKRQPIPLGYRIGGILNSIHVMGVQTTRTGYVLSVGASDFREIFFEVGTRARKGRGKTKAAQAVAGGRGIKAGRFLKKGLKDGGGNIPDHIRAAMS